MRAYKKTTKNNIIKYYKTSWKSKLTDPNLTRLKVYKVINSEFITTKHLDLPFRMRKMISKIRCSDHPLEIEKGRHLNIPRDERTCKVCTDGVIEDEEHFLLKCEVYQTLRVKYHMYEHNIQDFLNTENQGNLAKYIIDALRG